MARWTNFEIVLNFPAIFQLANSEQFYFRQVPDNFSDRVTIIVKLKR